MAISAQVLHASGDAVLPAEPPGPSDVAVSMIHPERVHLEQLHPALPSVVCTIAELLASAPGGLPCDELLAAFPTRRADGRSLSELLPPEAQDDPISWLLLDAGCSYFSQRRPGGPVVLQPNDSLQVRPHAATPTPTAAAPRPVDASKCPHGFTLAAEVVADLERRRPNSGNAAALWVQLLSLTPQRSGLRSAIGTSFSSKTGARASKIVPRQLPGVHGLQSLTLDIHHPSIIPAPRPVAAAVAAFLGEGGAEKEEEEGEGGMVGADPSASRVSSPHPPPPTTHASETHTHPSQLPAQPAPSTSAVLDDAPPPPPAKRPRMGGVPSEVDVWRAQDTMADFDIDAELQGVQVLDPILQPPEQPESGPRAPAVVQCGSLQNMAALGHLPLHVAKAACGDGFFPEKLQQEGIRDLNHFFGLQTALAEHVASARADLAERWEHLVTHMRPRPPKPGTPHIPCPAHVQSDPDAKLSHEEVLAALAAEVAVTPMLRLLLQGREAERHVLRVRNTPQLQGLSPPQLFLHAGRSLLHEVMSEASATARWAGGEGRVRDAPPPLAAVERLFMAAKLPPQPALVKHKPYSDLRQQHLTDVLPSQAELTLIGQDVAALGSLALPQASRLRARISKVCHPLGLYVQCLTNPVKSKSTYGRFFTNHSQLRNLARTLLSEGIITKSDTYVDFSAGHNDFGPLLQLRKWVGFDLYPPSTPQPSQHFRRVNWFNVKSLPKDCVIGLNPPFGKRGELALRFLVHAMSAFRPRLILAIIPRDTQWQRPAAKFGYAVHSSFNTLVAGSVFYIPGSSTNVGQQWAASGATGNISIAPQDTPAMLVLKRGGAGQS